MITISARGGVVTTRRAVTGVTSSVCHDHAPHVLKKTKASGALVCELKPPTKTVGQPMVFGSKPLHHLPPPVFKEPIPAPVVVPHEYREYPKFVRPHGSWITIKLPPEPAPSVIGPSVFDMLVARLTEMHGAEKIVVDKKRRTIKVRAR